MIPHRFSLLAAILLLGFACQNSNTSNSTNSTAENADKPVFTAAYGTPILDGSAADDVWEQADWYPLDQVWIGAPPDPNDFTGQYKLAWDENNLYILALITDDSLIDTHTDGLDAFWDDDCLEIFIDEDSSGGNHQYSFNAFAYHIALDGKVVDIVPDSTCRFFDDHCLTRRITRDHVSTWEVAVRIYDGNQFSLDKENIPKLLSEGKTMGFALAYCDNDHSPERENFIGSVFIPGKDKNVGWINADVFGHLILK